MNTSSSYRAEIEYRQQSIRRGSAEARLAKQVRPRRPRRMEPVAR